MSQTPEGKVKDRIKKVLDARKPRLYYDMPVPSGYGKSMLDFVGAFCGHAFAIEAKAGRKKPTERQEGTREDMSKAGIMVFCINEFDGWDALDRWIAAIKEYEACNT